MHHIRDDDVKGRAKEFSFHIKMSIIAVICGTRYGLMLKTEAQDLPH